MINVRSAEERGRSDLGWLDSRHTFSFGRYVDRRHTGFGSLRVINEDRVAGGGGFPDHPHRDMEILTYVLDGALEHRDDAGNHLTLRAGELQRMTAGRGIVHSEFNASKHAPVHFYQIWIEPQVPGLDPGHQHWRPPAKWADDDLILVASPDARDGSMTIHQDAAVYLGRIAPDKPIVHPLRPERRAWLQVLRGQIEIDGRHLGAGDGASMAGAFSSAHGVESGEFMLFDLA